MRILTLLLLVACSRGELLVEEEATPPEPVVVIPALGVTSPERGSFIEAGSVKLAGSVEQGSAALDRLTLNGSTDIGKGRSLNDRAPYTDRSRWPMEMLMSICS